MPATSFRICLLFAIAIPQLAMGQSPAKYALLVGVTQYSHAALNQPPLEYPEADAKALAEVLRNSGYEVDLLIGSQATQSAIQSKLEGLGSKGNQAGVVIIGLWGHGIEFEGDDDAMFCPYSATMRQTRYADGSVARDKKTQQPLFEPDPKSLIGVSEVLGAMRSCGAGNRLLLADCCRNSPHIPRGRAFGDKIKVSELPRNTTALFACSTGEKAFESSDWGHGAFTKCFLDLLPTIARESKDVEAYTGELRKSVSSGFRVQVPSQ